MSQILTAIIDTQKSNYKSIGQVNAADDLELELEVKMNGKPIEFINPECELLIKKSDKNKVRQLKDIRYEDGKFRIKVDEQGVTYPGIVTNQLVINDEGRVSTCLFYFMVGTSLDKEILQSISKIETLEQLDEYVVTAFANLEEYEKRLIAGDSAIRKLNDDMIAAEKVRDAAEQKREEFKLLLESKLENGEFTGATGERGPQGEQGIQGPQGPKGDTPDMTAFEKKINAQYEDIEKKVDEHIANHPQGGGTSIDDTTISTEKTWSSSKIEDFTKEKVNNLRLISNLTLNDEVNVVFIDVDNSGKQFELEEIFIKIIIKATTNNTNDMDGVIAINTDITSYFSKKLSSIKGLMRKQYDGAMWLNGKLNGEGWDGTYAIRNVVNDGNTTGSLHFINVQKNKCTNIVIGDSSAMSDAFLGIGTEIYVWGR